MECYAVNANCDGMKRPPNDMSNTITPLNGGDSQSLSAAASSLASHVAPSIAMQTTAFAEDSQSKSLFFSQEASTIFDKALEMHVAPTDDPPMWGDDLEDYREVANMLDDHDDLSPSNEASRHSDFNSQANLKSSTSEESFGYLMGSAETYGHESPLININDGGFKSEDLFGGGLNGSNTASDGPAKLPVHLMNMDRRIFEDNMFIGDTPQAESDHVDPFAGSGFDESDIFDDPVPEDMLNLKLDEHFDSPALNASPQPPMQALPLVTPKKSITSHISHLDPSKSYMPTVIHLPKAGVESPSKDYKDYIPGTCLKQRSTSSCGSFEDSSEASSSESQSHKKKQGDRSISNAAWERRFTELEEFKRQNGHCNVPQKYPENPSLGAWVARQRLLMRQWEDQHEDARTCNLTNERVQRFKNIGLESSIGKGAFGKLCSRNVNEWEKQFSKLLEYREANGTCNVPTKSSSLGRWVSNQRKKYREFHADKGRGKDQVFGWDKELRNRFKRLEDVGFNFYVGRCKAQPKDSR